MGYPSRFAGLYNAAEFAYGINKTTPALIVIGGPNTTSGAQALQVAFGYTQCNDGTVFNPLNTNAPIIVGGNSSTETVTPSAVSTSTPTQYSTTSLTSTFAYLHGNGDQVRSGTCGLQEALNYAGLRGGGTVVIDASWVALGGTQAMVSAATVPANVGFMDNRLGANYSSLTYTLTSTQITNLSTTAVELLPAPNAAAYWSVNQANLVNLYSTTSFTGGSALTIGYGSTVATDALSGTVAATFLTTPTANEVIQVGPGLTTAVLGSAVLGQGIYISNATTAFAAGKGSLQVTLNAALITT